jgi:hypothetical protein
MFTTSNQSRFINEMVLVFLPTILILMYEAFNSLVGNTIFLIGVIEALWILILRPKDIFNGGK